LKVLADPRKFEYILELDWNSDDKGNELDSLTFSLKVKC